MAKDENLSIEELQGLKYSLVGIKKVIGSIDDPVARDSHMREICKLRAAQAEQMIEFNRLVNEEIARRQHINMVTDPEISQAVREAFRKAFSGPR